MSSGIIVEFVTNLLVLIFSKLTKNSYYTPMRTFSEPEKYLNNNSTKMKFKIKIITK